MKSTNRSMPVCNKRRQRQRHRLKLHDLDSLLFRQQLKDRQHQRQRCFRGQLPDKPRLNLQLDQPRKESKYSNRQQLEEGLFRFLLHRHRSKGLGIRYFALFLFKSHVRLRENVVFSEIILLVYSNCKGSSIQPLPSKSVHYLTISKTKHPICFPHLFEIGEWKEKRSGKSISRPCSKM